MTTKLCIQHKFLTDNERAAIRASKWIGVKVLDDPQSLADYSFQHTIGRRVFDDMAMANWNNMLRANPQSLADWWIARVAGDIATAPKAQWEVVNEFCPPDLPSEYADFEIACMKWAESIGVKLVIGNFAVGNPPDMAWWIKYRKALDHARANGHSFGYHGYYGIQNKQPALVEWNLDRLEIVRKTYPGILDGMKVYWTELGVDRVEHINTPGYRTALNDDEYLAQLTSFVHDLMNARPYITAGFIYIRSGQASEQNFEIQGLMPRLSAFVDAANSGLPAPTPAPIPTPTPTPVPPPVTPQYPASVAISNPNFEMGSLKLTADWDSPNGWLVYQEKGRLHVELEAKNDDLKPPHAIDGYAARLWGSYEVVSGGLYQVVPAIVGHKYRLVAHAMGWSSNTGRVGDPSVPNAEIYSWVGINPLGSTDLNLAVAWSPDQNVADRWATMTVEAVAKSDKITLLLSMAGKFAEARNDVWFDNCELFDLGPAVVDPTPPSGPTRYEVIGSSGVNIRRTPNKLYVPVGKLPKGFPFSGRPVTDSWVMVEGASGASFYVARADSGVTLLKEI